MIRGLIIGRFQPPHLGHLKIIQSVLKECDELVIVIAAAQSSFSVKNPFTAGERLLMMRTMLENNNIDLRKVWLIPAQDVYDNDIWVHHILRLIPPVDKIYGNNPFIKLLWQRFGYEMISTEMFDRKLFEGRQIRLNMANGIAIDDIIDITVMNILQKIDAENRLKSLYYTDSESSGEPTSNITK